MREPLYVPIVRSKQSEMLALRHLSQEVKDSILPLIDLVAPSKEEDKKNPERFIEKNIASLTRLTGLSRVMLDSSEIDSSIRLSSGAHPLIEAAQKLQAIRFEVIPVVGLSRDKAHWSAAAKIVAGQSRKYACIRFDDYDLETPADSAERALFFAHTLLTSFDAFYFVYDFRDVFSKDASLLVRRAETMNSRLRKLGPLLTIIAGCGIPEKLTDAVPTRSSDYIQRTEVGMWKQFQRISGLGKNAILGDYTTVTPDHVEVDFQIIHKTMGPKVIYALPDQWFVIRGGSFQSHPLGRGQYFELAKSVSHLPDYPGEDFCYGDKYIGERARGIGTCGSPASWITACVNRHITHTVQTIGS